MIRLAIRGAEESRCQALAARLRGASIERGSLASFDALAVLGAPGDEIDQALQAGKPVLVAGDLPPTLLPKLVAKSHAIAANPERYLPSRQLIKQHLDAGKLGTPGLIRIHRWQAALEQGALLRDLDLVRWYFQADVRVVYAVKHARSLQLHLGLAGDGMATIDHASVPAGDAYYSLTLIGANGAASADDHANVQLAYQGGPVRGIRADEGIVQWVTMLQQFIDAIASGRVDGFDRMDVAADMRVADAIERSVATKQSIALEGGR